MRFAVIGVLILLVCASLVYARVGGGDIVYEIKHIGNVTFSHETHVETMGFNCTECHPSLFEIKDKHKKMQMSHRRQGMSCGACHEGKKAFDLKSNCYVCHVREVKK